VLKVPRQVAALARLAADVQHAKFGATVAVRLRETEAGGEAVSTDGRRLAVVQWPNDEEALDLELEFQEDGSHEALVPAADLARLLKALPTKNVRPAWKVAYVGLGRHQAHFRVGNATE